MTMRVAVVIPFFQEQTGLLARALASVAGSQGHGATLDIIVVDDASPAPPEADLALVDPALKSSIRILRRRNGGPARARNSALRAVTDDTDVVAFLDSDDAWRASHLARGLQAIVQGADFYFSNALMTDGRDWFTAHRFTDLNDTSPPHRSQDPQAWSPERTLAVLSATYLSPTPTVIYRWARHRQVRFDPRLRGAGEDHLFWLDLAAHSRRCALSREVEVEIGRGLNAHLSIDSWSHPDAARIHLAQLLFYKIALFRYGQRLQRTFPDHADRLQMERSRYRRLTMRLILGSLARSGRFAPSVLARLLRHDPACLLSTFAAVQDALSRRSDPPPPAPAFPR